MSDTRQQCQHPKCKKLKRKYSKSRFCTKHQGYSTLTRWARAVRSAKFRRLAFKLKFQQYLSLIKRGCFYCGGNLLMMTGSALDRKNNKYGYSTKNSIPCCPTCNYVRGNNFTVREFKKIIDFVRQMRHNKTSIWPEFSGLKIKRRRV